MITFPSHWDKSVLLYVEQERFDDQCFQYADVVQQAKLFGLAARIGERFALLFHPQTQILDDTYHAIQCDTGNGDRCRVLDGRQTYAPGTIQAFGHREDPEQALYVAQTWFERQIQQYEYLAAYPARQGGLIAGAFGGYLYLLHPKKQIADGEYHRIQVMTGNMRHCHELEPTWA